MWIGSGPYVVIDNRNKEISKSQDDQSDEGNVLVTLWTPNYLNV